MPVLIELYVSLWRLSSCGDQINFGLGPHRSGVGPVAAELLQNGDFASSTGWTLEDRWTIAGGKLKRTATGGSEDSAQQLEADLNDDLLVSTLYVLVITIDSIGGGTIRPWLGDAKGPKLSEAGTYTIYLTPTDVTDGLRLQSDGPRSPDTPLAVEHISNGDFSGGDTDWTLGGQWSVAGGKLTRTPGTGDPILGPELISDTARNSTFDAGNSRGDWATNQTSYLKTSATGGFGNSGCLKFTPTLNDPINVVLDDQYLAGGTLLPGTEYKIAMGFVDIIDVTAEFPMKLSCTILDDVHADVVSAVTSWVAAATSSFSAILTSGSVAITGGQIRFQRTDGGDASYPLAFVDNFSIKVVTGYSPTGPDTASQVAGDLAVAFVEGKTYRLYFTVDSISGGTVTPSLAGTSGSAVSTAGDHEQDIVAGASGGIDFDGSISLTIQMDDVSVLELVSGLTIQMDDASVKLSGVDAGEGQGFID